MSDTPDYEERSLRGEIDICLSALEAHVRSCTVLADERKEKLVYGMRQHLPDIFRSGVQDRAESLYAKLPRQERCALKTVFCGRMPSQMDAFRHLVQRSAFFSRVGRDVERLVPLCRKAAKLLTLNPHFYLLRRKVSPHVKAAYGSSHLYQEILATQKQEIRSRKARALKALKEILGEPLQR